LKKLVIAALLGVAVLAGCEDHRTPEQLEQEKKQQAYEAKLKADQQATDAQRRIDAQQRWLHSCDNNGGVAQIYNGKYDTTMICGNKLESRLNSYY
jgi:hypothetical protein